jgi:Transglutaminase-like superfamily
LGLGRLTANHLTVLRPLVRKARSFWRLPLFVQAWMLPLWFVLGLAKALIFGLSFRRLAPWLGRPVGLAGRTPLLDPDQEFRAQQISLAVRTAARYTPWESNCFPQAVAARLLLGLYGVPYALYFGLMRQAPQAQVQAHAWVAAGRVKVTGGLGFGRYTVVACFVAPTEAVA